MGGNKGRTKGDRMKRGKKLKIVGKKDRHKKMNWIIQFDHVWNIK